MGINTGAFIAPLITGWLAQSETFRAILESAGIGAHTSWHWGFGAAAVGMLCGLIQYSFGGKHLSPALLRPVRPSDPAVAARVDRQVRLAGLVTAGVLVLAIALVAGGVLSLDVDAITRNFKWVLLGITVAFFAWLFLRGEWTAEERKRLIVITVLFVAASVFWMAYEQAGSTLNLFAERNTRNAVLGHNFPAAWYQSLPPLFIILFAPVFAAIWLRLGTRNPSSPAKFAIALVFLAVGFALMIGAASAAASGTRVSPLWLLFSYLFQTLGELCLSPVGLSAMSRLAPARVAGLVMGVWFLASAVGNFLAGSAANVYETMPLPTLFTIVTAIALAAALVLVLMIKPIRRMLER
jgi:POT family proton-dependent oligopeptide transporter